MITKTRFTASLMLLLSLLLLSACDSSTPTSAATPESAPTLAAQPATEGEPVRVAVLAIRSAVAAQAQYGPVLAYLSEQIGRPFEFVPVGQADQFTVVEGNEVDFTFNNPLAGVEIKRLHNTEFLATLSRANTGPEFSALIIARADSGIKTATDLKGKNVACVNFKTAAAGCVFQTFHVVQAGLDPFEDFASFTEESSQDNIVLGVLNGTWDVGFVRTGQVERMVAEGKLLNADEIAIIDKADDGFFLPHTTALYPEWPFAALSSTDPALAPEVKAALLAMSADHPAMVNANAVGFLADIDYSSVNDLIIALQLPSWDVPQ